MTQTPLPLMIDQPRVVAHLMPEDRTRLRELRTLYESETGDRLSISDTIRLAIREAFDRRQTATR